VIRLDRFACCGLELYDLMAIAEENAGYGDRSAPVRCRSAKFSITALVMHPPIHHRILRPLPATALIQVKRPAFSRRNLMPYAVTLPRQYSKEPSSNNQLTLARVGMRQPPLSR
jgi:hypothetical protein